jgi:hypothetical protein
MIKIVMIDYLAFYRLYQHDEWKQIITAHTVNVLTRGV